MFSSDEVASYGEFQWTKMAELDIVRHNSTSDIIYHTCKPKSDPNLGMTSNVLKDCSKHFCFRKIAKPVVTVIINQISGEI